MNNATVSTSARLVHTSAASVSLLRVALSALLAAALNLVVYWLGVASGASMQVASPQPVSALSVVLFSLLPILVAGVGVWSLNRRFALRRLAGWTGLFFALATIAGSLLAAADTTTALVLSAMHIVVGTAWAFALQPWVKDGPSPANPGN